jgi:hypothetical protein
MLSTQIICQPGKLPGIPKLNPLLSMPWPPSADICGSNGIRQFGLLPWVPSIHRSLSLTCSLRLLAMLLKMAKVEKICRQEIGNFKKIKVQSRSVTGFTPPLKNGKRQTDNSKRP